MSRLALGDSNKPLILLDMSHKVGVLMARSYHGHWGE